MWIKDMEGKSINLRMKPKKEKIIDRFSIQICCSKIKRMIKDGNLSTYFDPKLGFISTHSRCLPKAYMNNSEYYGEIPSFKYCPFCGAKIVITKNIIP
jgi:hypothetical protein